MILKKTPSAKAEDLIDDLFADIETPVQDEDGNPINHLEEHGYEIMIMDKKDGHETLNNNYKNIYYE